MNSLPRNPQLPPNYPNYPAFAFLFKVFLNIQLLIL
jgi:hypothetical protein